MNVVGMVGAIIIVQTVRRRWHVAAAGGVIVGLVLGYGLRLLFGLTFGVIS